VPQAFDPQCLRPITIRADRIVVSAFDIENAACDTGLWPVPEASNVTEPWHFYFEAIQHGPEARVTGNPLERRDEIPRTLIVSSSAPRRGLSVRIAYLKRPHS